MPIQLSRPYPSINQERNGVALRTNVPAPYGGLNTRDSESQMEPTDAILMENFFPIQGSVQTRKGFTSYCTGLTGYVETLIDHNSGANRKFLACHSDKISDITNPASISTLKTGLTSARWQTASMGGYTLLFNGSDAPLLFDGSTITTSTINGSGLTASNLDGVNVFKNRCFVWNSNKPEFWYGSTLAIQGTFTKFDLSNIARGNLTCMVSTSRDGGKGPADFAIFIMSSGDVVVYDGDDPSTAAAWSLVGVYRIGKPLSVRSARKIGGDVLILTNQDFVYFSEVAQNDSEITSQSKLSGAAVSSAQSYGANYGWEIAVYPKGAWLLINVPVATNQTYHQYVVNTITGAATKFTGMNASTWGLFKDSLYFGGNGQVFQADSGFNDNGNYINCKVQSAYGNLGSPNDKTLNSFRNTIKTDGSVVVNSIVNFDYGRNQTKQTNSSVAQGYAWDTFLWDTTPWSPENYGRNDLIYSSGQGVDLSMRIETSLKGQQLSWYRTDYSVSVNNNL